MPLFIALTEADVDWSRVDVFQVDERWTDSPRDRNWTAVELNLVGPTGARGHPLTVGGEAGSLSRSLSIESDIATLEGLLGDAMTFDVVHLGLGTDGHTASWPPGNQLDSLLSTSSPVAEVAAFNGFDRTTLTPQVVNRARSVAWFVIGEAKTQVLRRLIAGDPAMPATRVAVTNQQLFTDVDFTQ